jgi:hypothetical protein
MRKFIRNHNELTALLIMPSALPGFIGRELAAQVDLIRGRYEILSAGLRPRTGRPRRILITSIHPRGE